MLLGFRAQKAVDGRLNLEQILNHILEMVCREFSALVFEKHSKMMAPSTVSRTTGAMAISPKDLAVREVNKERSTCMYVCTYIQYK